MSNPAETYESYMVPALFGPWASRLVEFSNAQPGERVLDVACGTGVVARQVASRGTTAALDHSPYMLAVARAMAEREGHAVAWHRGRAESLPFADGSFDLVLCQQALQFFADRGLALGEMRRVLAGGARVALSVWRGLEHHPFYQRLHDVIHERLGMSGVAQIFALGDATGLGSLLERAGFRDVEIEPVSMTARFPDPHGFLAGEVDVDTASIPSMQHLSAAERQSATAAIRDDMGTALREVTEGEFVVIPFHAHLARAHR